MDDSFDFSVVDFVSGLLLSPSSILVASSSTFLSLLATAASFASFASFVSFAAAVVTADPADPAASVDGTAISSSKPNSSSSRRAWRRLTKSALRPSVDRPRLANSVLSSETVYGGGGDVKRSFAYYYESGRVREGECV